MKSIVNEETYDEINAELRAIVAADDGVFYEEEVPPKLILIGSGEDCQIVLFGHNYNGGSYHGL